jgi:hypothetical protein
LAHHQPHAADGRRPFAHHVVAGLLHRHRAVGVLRGEDDALHGDLLVLDELHDRVVVLRSEVLEEVRRDQDVHVLVVSHRSFLPTR